ncbi:MAG: glycerol-3-phosphate dehydrogenase/oxidase [Planctomycetaceae bacterium]|nr:glycerol-3-phosphate dehydrogenase/oxidase [Planctomycetaceae bacterium]
MQRTDGIQRLGRQREPWDLLVIGGGATGASILLDAATRGLSAVLLEQHDFGKGTSTRSTKLVHGGVRYLAQGNVSLVREALRERARLRANAPHVVHEMSFLVPCRNLWQQLWYATGFKMYDLLAGRSGFRKARSLRRADCLDAVPTLRPEWAAGGILYSDGQFDDARLLINILQTAQEQGAVPLNYFRVDRILKDNVGRAIGVGCTDQETGQSHEVQARMIINATGPFCDVLRQRDDPQAERVVAASQGIHLVLPARFLPGQTAVIVPKTSDGRVIFMIPWEGHVLIGTTDTPIPEAVLEPRAQAEEVEFLLTTAAQYLTEAPTAGDVLSVFTGIRPLVGKGQGSSSGQVRTARLSRDHTILRSPSGMITITGGKWTTARKMAEDCIDRALEWSGLPSRPCGTVSLRLHGATDSTASHSLYGSDAEAIEALARSDSEFSRPLVEGYPLRAAEVIWSVRHEMARTVEDVLARRSRLLFLNAQAALQAAPAVARWMSRELQREENWQQRQLTEFEELVGHYKL